VYFSRVVTFWSSAPEAVLDEDVVVFVVFVDAGGAGGGLEDWPLTPTHMAQATQRTAALLRTTFLDLMVMMSLVFR
jgi:hypothetical protein